MAAEKNKSAQNTSDFWEVREDGREITRSSQIIANTLEWLKTKRAFLTLLHHGYQSGSTILIDYDREGLIIDKPKDWPGRETNIQVLFKDDRKLWNHFPLEVQTSGNSLLSRLPLSICRLQRRAHFRVEPSRGSTASFTHRGTTYSMIPLKNISAGGMELHPRSRLVLDRGNTITDILISIPEGKSLLTPNEPGDLVIRIGHGQVSWKAEKFSYGVSFTASKREEKVLLRYIRQRELMLLRKGMGDTV